MNSKTFQQRLETRVRWNWYDAAVFALLAGLSLVSGCVSKSKADADAKAAFLAGQRQTAMIAWQGQIKGPTVTVVGSVRNPLVPWTADLTLAKALLAAQYYGQTDPSEILIQRNGQEIRYDPKQLLDGTDVQLQPSDVVQVRN